MERLSHLISKAVGDGTLKGVRILRNGQILSHVLFENDMILFREASLNQMRVMFGCMEQFYAFSGQKINYHKS